MPRTPDAAGQTEHDLQWLPRFEGRVPLDIPSPVALGQPNHAFPVTWGIYRWLPGEPAHREAIADLAQAARDLAHFIRALQSVDSTGGPQAQAQQRGAALVTRDEWTRENIARLPPEFDQAALLTLWEESLAAPEWGHPPVWLHGDLQSGNLLTLNGNLSAVIDFGALKLGDPAADFSVAWNWLDADARAAFREQIATDEASWLRGFCQVNFLRRWWGQGGLTIQAARSTASFQV